MKRLQNILLSLVISALAWTVSFNAVAEEISFGLKSHVRKVPSFKRSGQKSDKAESERPLPEHSPYTVGDVHLKEFYGYFSPGDFQFRLGRQKYAIGTGYGWNPTDLFNPLKILDPTYEPEGIDSAFLSYSFGDDHEISTFYSFGTPLEEKAGPGIRRGGYQLMMKTHTEVLDMAIHYTEANRNRTDHEGLVSGSVSSDEATIPVRWRLLAAGVSSEIGGFGLHAEGGHAWLNLEEKADQLPEDIFAKNHSRFLVGIDYTFENELYLVLEYYQEGQGNTSPDEYTLNDRLAYLSGERGTIGRDNLFVGAKYPIADMTSIELYHIINANDPSVIVNPWLVWAAGEDFTVKFSAQIPVGKEDSSLGQTGPSAFAHIQLNF